MPVGFAKSVENNSAYRVSDKMTLSTVFHNFTHATLC